MTPMPASCPAEVSVVMEITTACHHAKPMVEAIMPNVNATDRYPSPMGIPAFSPFPNIPLVFKILASNFCKIPSGEALSIPGVCFL